MTKDEIQFWMLIAFAAASVLGFYKVYFIFNTPLKGIDTKTQHDQLEDIILNFLKQSKDTGLTSDTLYKELTQLDTLQDDAYKNFNQNRCNQLLQRLLHTYKAESIKELIEKVHHLDLDRSKNND